MLAYVAEEAANRISGHLPIPAMLRREAAGRQHWRGELNPGVHVIVCWQTECFLSTQADPDGNDLVR